MAIVLVLPLFVGLVPGSSATTECASNLSSVPVGTGTALIDQATLNGVNHVDIPIPGCSEGRFSFGTGTDPGVSAQKFCLEGFIRVYAAAGTFDNTFVVLWLPDDGKGCAATVEEPPLLPVPPLP